MPKKPNKLGAAGRAVPGSLPRPDPPRGNRGTGSGGELRHGLGGEPATEDGEARP